MDATRRQRVLRALTLMLLGTSLGALATLDPLAAFRWPPFWTLLATMGLWTVVENIALRQDEPKEYSAKLQTRIMQGTVVLAVVVGVVDAWHFTPLGPRGVTLTLAGVVLVSAGALVRLIAIRTLDRHFSYELRVEKDHEIVQRGIYSVLRHPSYLGIILVAAGAPLIVQSVPGAFVGLVVMGGVTVWRITTEERMLRDAFGEEYLDYSARSWRLLPYLY